MLTRHASIIDNRRPLADTTAAFRLADAAH
jgi:hypothetical protein